MVEGHLGGYIPGGDPATWYPTLWRALVREMGVNTVLDIGCGDGVALAQFLNFGATVAIGVDGMEVDNPLIFQHDFTTGPWERTSKRRFNLVWCCEFVEHVEQRYIPNYLEAFKLGDMVLMTHAIPGQPGYHHVNCQTADYWTGVMAAAGFSLSDKLTALTRSLALQDSFTWSDDTGEFRSHFIDRGLAFIRNGVRG